MFPKLSRSMKNRYLLLCGLFLLILFFAFVQAKNLPVTGLEIFYASLSPH